MAMTDIDLRALEKQEKVAEAIRRSLKFLPGSLKGVVESLVQPATLAIITGTLVVWAGSHFFGIGEIVDIILLTVGFFGLGFAVFDGAQELYEFTTVALGASSNAELDRAGQHFASAVTLLGISTIQALLLRGAGSKVIARGRPQIRPRMNVGSPPAAGNKLRVSRPDSIAGGSLGETNAYGAIQIARNQSLSEQRVTLFHELVHRYFSPRTGPLRQLRAEIRMAGYKRSAFLAYLEEALAEGYGQLRVHGMARALQAYRFPVSGGYVTVSELLVEGQAIGTITVGGTILRVSMSPGNIPGEP